MYRTPRSLGTTLIRNNCIRLSKARKCWTPIYSNFHYSLKSWKLLFIWTLSADTLFSKPGAHCLCYYIVIDNELFVFLISNHKIAYVTTRSGPPERARAADHDRAAPASWYIYVDYTLCCVYCKLPLCYSSSTDSRSYGAGVGGARGSDECVADLPKTASIDTSTVHCIHFTNTTTITNTLLFTVLDT